MLIFLTGASGSGKTEIAKRIHARCGGHLVVRDVDYEDSDFTVPVHPGKDEKAHFWLKRRVRELILKAKEEIQNSGKIFVISGMAYIEETRRVAGELGMGEVKFLLVRLAKEEREKRLSERGNYHRDWNESNHKVARILDITVGAQDMCLDTTELTEDQAADSALDWILKTCAVGRFTEAVMLNDKQRMLEEAEKLTDGYQVYDPRVSPPRPPEQGRVYDKLCSLRYVPGEFKDLSVIDVGCCLGFFTFHSAYLGASRVVGCDSRQDYVRCCRFFGSTCVSPDFGGRTEFRETDIRELPDLGKYQVVLFHAMLHWFWIWKSPHSMRDVFSWLHRMCEVGVYFEGCVDADEEVMQRAGVPKEKYNLGRILEVASLFFRDVNVVGPSLYNRKRRVIRFLK